MEDEKLKYPIYKLLKRDDGDFVYALSNVINPANEKNSILFNKEEEEKEFVEFFAEDKKKRLASIVMIPGQMIFRKANGGYFLTADEETIRDIAENYIEKENTQMTTENHEKDTTGIPIVESWVIDDIENDKANSLGFKNLVKGSWVVIQRIDNEELLMKYESGELTGISVEGTLSKQLLKFNKELPNDIEDYSDEELSDLYIEILERRLGTFNPKSDE